MLLQQPLPFTVLKRREEENRERDFVAEPTEVATAPTVYGIETSLIFLLLVYSFLLVATVLNVYGIETYQRYDQLLH